MANRNGKCIAHLAGFISDKDYYADVPTPRPADLTGNGAMKMADEQRSHFLKQSATAARDRLPGPEVMVIEVPTKPTT